MSRPRSLWSTLAERVNLLRGHALDCPCEACWAIRGAGRVATIADEGVTLARAIQTRFEPPPTPVTPPAPRVTVTVDGKPVEAEWIEVPPRPRK